MQRTLMRIAVVGMVALACSDANAPVQDPCLAGQEVTVISRDAVRFSWQACGMSVLYVRPVSGAAVTWWIESDTNNIQSPVVYGVVPAGVAELTPPAPLEQGVDYRVTIVRRYGSRVNDLTAVGARVFTVGVTAPPPANAARQTTRTHQPARVATPPSRMRRDPR